MRTNSDVQAAPSSVVNAANKPARRLGRGLSSLLGAPVKVEIEAPPAPAESLKPEAGGAIASTIAEPASVAGVQKPEPPGVRGESARPKSDRARGGGGGSGGGAAPSEPSAAVEMIAIDAILPSRFQPRRRFEEGPLAELAASIRSAGVVQPVLVRPMKVSSGSASSLRYELVAGERRWRAAGLAGLSRVPAVVADLADEQAAEWALIENVQRADLGAMETAYAVRGLCEQFGLTHARAAEKLGLDRTSVTNLVRLTELEPEVRELLEAGTLSAGHGKVLLGMAPGARRAALAARAAGAGWSVRRLGGAVSLLMQGNGDAADAGDRAGVERAGADGLSRGSLAHAGMRELEKQLGEHLGTKVQIKVRSGGKRGSLRIDFYDLDHFDGLMAKMGFVMQ